jgi:pimeloyl-ACP methyl ester carboxylesterase
MALNIIGVCVHGLGGNLFSTGMDKLAAELNRTTPVGCHFTVRGGNDPRLEDATITSDLVSALSKGATVIYIGHSLGADSALRFAQAAHNFMLPLICPVDPVSWDSNAQHVVPGRWEVGSNVARVIGFRTNTFPGGGRIVLGPGNTVTNISDTTLNVPHANIPGALDIASAPEVHSAIIAGVSEVVKQMQAVA